VSYVRRRRALGEVNAPNDWISEIGDAVGTIITSIKGTPPPSAYVQPATPQLLGIPTWLWLAGGFYLLTRRGR